MSDHVARRIAVQGAVDGALIDADLAAQVAADQQPNHARRFAVLADRFGDIGNALARGDQIALTSALLATSAASAAWLVAIQEEAAR